MEGAKVRDEKLLTAEQQTGGLGQRAGVTEEEQSRLEGAQATMARDRDRREAEVGLRAAGNVKRLEQPLATKAAKLIDMKAKYHVISR